MVLADRFEIDFDLPPSAPNLGIYKVISHLLQIIFAFLTLCVTVPIIVAERKFYNTSQGNPNFTLFVTAQTILIAAALTYFPFSKINKKVEVGCYATIRRFFLRPRSRLIFSIYMAICWFIAMIVMTAHTTKRSNCALDSNLLEKDDSYEDTWNNQCRCARASAAFSWLSFFISTVPVVISGVLMWHEKKLIHAEPKPAREVDAIDEKRNSSSSYNEDAPTIVDTDIREKDKESIISYQFSSPLGDHVNTPIPNNITTTLPSPSLSAHGTPHSSNQARSYTPSLASPYMHQDTSLCLTSPPLPPLHYQHPYSASDTPALSTISAPYLPPGTQAMISSPPPPAISQHYAPFIQPPPPPSSQLYDACVSGIVPSAPPMQYPPTTGSGSSNMNVNSPYQHMVPPSINSYMSPPPSTYSCPSQTYYIAQQQYPTTTTSPMYSNNQPSYHRP
ncbi:hypothetical protein BDF20DRAFT_833150 [Mycotypha africana]|uniref:uncharacterized protein n=1 Tax=Mycotypha africana TaxID=64632 RepID=UPI0023013C8F|nr:uncharacterized protein BDF20DRAFT_833150 [Mycotypha africana]KAI8988283.1 hypothetical protein BDF20DRAFT_833150 [Mycotypha africana]